LKHVGSCEDRTRLLDTVSGQANARGAARLRRRNDDNIICSTSAPTAESAHIREEIGERRVGAEEIVGHMMYSTSTAPHAQHSTAQHSTVQHSTARHDRAPTNAVQQGQHSL
jgi:hypothetical protein